MVSEKKTYPRVKNRKILRSMDNGIKARQFGFARTQEDFYFAKRVFEFKKSAV